MSKALNIFIDSLEVKFLHIRKYDLDYTWSIPERVLPQTVLWLLEEGEVSLRIDDQIQLVAKAGDILVLVGGSILQCRAVTSTVRLVSLNFDAGISFVPHRRWTELLRIPHRLAAAGSDHTGELIREMLQLSIKQIAGGPLLLQARLLELIASILNDDSWISTTNDEPSLLDSRILVIIDYLQSKPQMIPEVKDLADLVQLSESHLRKLFVRCTGLSPIQFIHFMKLEAARRKLAETNERISDIAYSLGFQDANYFARLFKERTGCNPGRYRRMNQVFSPEK